MRQHWPILASVGAVCLSWIVAWRMAAMGDLDDQMKLLLLALAAIATVTAAFRPRLSLALVVLISPWTNDVTLLGAQFKVGDVLLLFIGLALLPTAIRPSSIPRYFATGVTLLLAGLVIAGLVGEIPLQDWLATLRWLALAVAAIAGWVCATRRDVEVHLPALLTVSGVCVAIGTFMQVAGVSAIVGSPYLSDRYDSTFGYYTNAAGFMAMGVVLATMLAQKFSGPRRVIWTLLAAVQMIALIFNLSRGGIAATGVGLFAFLLLSRNRVSSGIIAAIGVASMALIAAWLVPSARISDLTQRFLDNPIGGVLSGNDQVRAAEQAKGQELLREHPLGIGYGQFRESTTHSSARELFHAHRLPVQMGLDAGWLGLLGFALMTAVPIGLAVKARFKGALGLATSAFAACLAGMWAQGWNDYLMVEAGSIVALVGCAFGASYLLHTGEASEVVPDKLPEPTVAKDGCP